MHTTACSAQQVAVPKAPFQMFVGKLYILSYEFFKLPLSH